MVEDNIVKDELGYIPSEEIKERFKNDVELIIRKGALNNIDRRKKLLNIMKSNKDTYSNLLDFYKKIIFNILLNDAEDFETKEFLEEFDDEYILLKNKKMLNDIIVNACIPATEEYFKEIGFLEELKNKYMGYSEKLAETYDKLVDLEYNELDTLSDYELEEIIENPNLDNDLDRIIKFILDKESSNDELDDNNYFGIISDAIANRKEEIDENLFEINTILDTDTLDLTECPFDDYGWSELIHNIRLFILNNYKKVINTEDAFIELYNELNNELNNSEENYPDYQKKLILMNLYNLGKKYGIELSSLANPEEKDVTFSELPEMPVVDQDNTDTVIKYKKKARTLEEI